MRIGREIGGEIGDAEKKDVSRVKIAEGEKWRQKGKHGAFQGHEEPISDRVCNDVTNFNSTREEITSCGNLSGSFFTCLSPRLYFPPLLSPL